MPPGALVAWRYRGGWQQIPVQVDERDFRDLATIYNEAPSGPVESVYTDPGTYTGPDTDPTLDADDEIVFMVEEAGDLSPDFGLPPHVIAGTGVEIAVIDPVDAGVGFVYLFRQDGTLDPGAGRTFGSYDFVLLAGQYPQDYNLLNGPNPEDTTVATPFYSHHFSDRWIDDGLRILAGDATGVDILDRHKSQFAPGDCSRSENTFSAGEGCFIVNKSGAVRGIRSYMGANSGVLTQREHLFYERRHDIRTFVRVHQISGLVSYFDYTPEAIGMTYRNDGNTGGVPIDGSPDVVAAGVLGWELVEGGQGSLIIVHGFDTDIPGLTPTSYYLDSNATRPPVQQCTGDPWAYGSSGPWFHGAIPCTDPVTCPQYFYRFTIFRTLYYEAPGATVADAAARAQRRDTPLGIIVSAWPPPSPLSVPADSSEGIPLTVRLDPANPQTLDLSWGKSCDAAVTVGYAIYGGALGDFDSHVPIICLVPATTVIISLNASGPVTFGNQNAWLPPAGSNYYLVVPVSTEAEGSYGTDSQGNERPASTMACKPSRPGHCP